MFGDRIGGENVSIGLYSIAVDEQNRDPTVDMVNAPPRFFVGDSAGDEDIVCGISSLVAVEGSTCNSADTSSEVLGGETELDFTLGDGILRSPLERMISASSIKSSNGENSMLAMTAFAGLVTVVRMFPPQGSLEGLERSLQKSVHSHRQN